MSIGIQKNNIYSNIFSKAFPQNNYAKEGCTDKEYSLRKAEYAQRLQDKNKGSIVDQAVSYADQLKASRTKSKDASLENKKLQYNFKKISSQIIRSKNSMSARRAVQSARHEISRLKRLKGNGEYDDEELQLAIDHAKAMEKIAKKKVAHLEQEEMVERAHKGSGAALEEIEDQKEDEKSESLDDKELSEEAPDEAALSDAEPNYDEAYGAYSAYDYATLNESFAREIEESQYDLQLELHELSEALSDNTEYIAEVSADSMSQLMDEFSQEMSEMLENMDLTELTETMYAPNPNMSEDDLKLLKIKHRGKELKEIAKADKEYLKGIMEHEKAKADSLGSTSGGLTGASSSHIFKDDAPRITPVISMPGAAAGAGMPAPMISGGFDVSI